MTEPPANLDDLPEAVAPPQRQGLSPVWLIPILALIIGGWIAVKAILERGPTVTISFLTAEGLEPGKTRIRYKDVDIGEVTDVSISEDRASIVVTAQITKRAEKFLVADSRFWVVRPRVTGGQITGFGTLLSGAFIGLDVGHSSEPERHFTGLEVAPILVADTPGRKLILQAEDLGSLDVGSPVYFRRIKVGEVVAHELAPHGSDVRITAFVHAPYDQFVGKSSRFWNASGIDVALDASGMHVQTQSMVSVMVGGIAFETPDNAEPIHPSDPAAEFVLQPNHATAMKPPNGAPLKFRLHFQDSLRGLKVGAPVEFRGITVGEVLAIDVEYQPEGQWFHFPVDIAIYPERMRISITESDGTINDTRGRQLLDAMVQHGFRAQLRTGNMLTGQLYVALDFFHDVPTAWIEWEQQPVGLPTLPGSIEELQAQVAKIVKKVDKIPFEQIGDNLKNSLAGLEQTLKSVEKLARTLDGQVAPEAKAAVAELRRTLSTTERALATDSPLQQELRETLNETSRAARALRSLADTLDRQPESLLRGKKEGE